MGLPCIVMGLGYIGRTIAKAALSVKGLDLVAAVDPAHAGERLERLLEGQPTELEIKGDLSEVARKAKGGVVFHATGSYLHQVEKQLDACVRARLNVISTCEELSYPWLTHKESAETLDNLAKDYGVRIVATGVNPGFVFERLGSIMSQVAGPVRSVRGVRVVDAITRRNALQLKTGAGLSPDEFVSRVQNGGFGHVGLRESAALLAMGVGLGNDLRISEEIAPVIAKKEIEAAVTVRQGQVAGIHQIARAYRGSDLLVTLDLTIALGAENPHDEIILETDPPLHLVVTGGTPGDSATAWAAVHAAQQVSHIAPGLRTVLDLPAGRMQ